MGQKVDLCKTCIMFALKNNLPLSKAMHLYQSILGDLEVDEDEFTAASEDILSVTKYMLTQKDGLYGLSHKALQIAIENPDVSLGGIIHANGGKEYVRLHDEDTFQEITSIVKEKDQYVYYLADGRKVSHMDIAEGKIRP